MNILRGMSGGILFVDNGCHKPYSLATLQHAALSGTEATVVRVAESLGAYVTQNNRTVDEGRYIRTDFGIRPEFVVVLNDPRTVGEYKAAYPKARVFLWLHSYFGPLGVNRRGLRRYIPELVACETTIICVSDFQMRQVESALRGADPQHKVRITRIYNPIDDDLVQDATPVDRNKLIFWSSPDKGLSHAIFIFNYVRQVAPDMKLYIGNPGYLDSPSLRAAGIIDVGPLPHGEIIQQVRSALCTFHPNYVNPETFGCVFAESNAVGTPVLTYSVGAAPEVLNDTRQVVCADLGIFASRVGQKLGTWGKKADKIFYACGVYQPYVERILLWRSGGRPKVNTQEQFRLRHVVTCWQQVLTS